MFVMTILFDINQQSYFYNLFLGKTRVKFFYLNSVACLVQEILDSFCCHRSSDFLNHYHYTGFSLMVTNLDRYSSKAMFDMKAEFWLYMEICALSILTYASRATIDLETISKRISKNTNL